MIDLRRAFVLISILFYVFECEGYRVPTDPEKVRYVDSREAVEKDICNIKCNTSAKYRTFDGSCNNLQNPCWGKSYRTFNYIIPPQYADDIGCPTIELPNTQPLPSVRLVSRVIHYDKKIESKRLTQIFTTYGQFQAHDTVTSPGTEKDKAYDCPLTRNDPCRNQIAVPPGDKYFTSPCISYGMVPGQFCDGNGEKCGCSVCKPGQWQYINGATSFLDGSHIYGPTEERANQLRVPGTAYLRMDGDKLARTKYPDSSLFSCNTTNGCDNTCFDVGDLAGNMNFPLLAMHTVWFKEHNRLVDKLKTRFTDNDVLFNEVRKIIVAMVQHITYAEYLPLVFGEKCMPTDLKVPSPSSEQGYNASIDPTALSECNFAACRYGHSLIKGFPTILGEKKEKYSIGDFGRLDMFCENNIINRIVGGLLQDKTMERDEFTTAEVTNKMHFPKTSESDLIAIGLLRARDHGVATYSQLFEYCGIKPPKNYDELKEFVPDEGVRLYRDLYGEKGMDNIDLYSAILSAKTISECGGILGRIAQCIVGEHHRRIKLGDRLWYENLDQPESLTQEQVQEIQKTTISRIICSNTELKVLQTRAFEQYSSNPQELCSSIVEKSDIDISKWN